MWSLTETYSQSEVHDHAFPANLLRSQLAAATLTLAAGIAAIVPFSVVTFAVAILGGDTTSERDG